MPCSEATNVGFSATSTGRDTKRDLTDKDSIEMTDVASLGTGNAFLAKYRSTPKHLTAKRTINVYSPPEGLIEVYSSVYAGLDIDDPSAATVDKVEVTDTKTLCDHAELEGAKKYECEETLIHLANELFKTGRRRWRLDMDGTHHGGKTATLYNQGQKIASIDNQTVYLAYALDFEWAPGFNFESDSEPE